MAAIEAQRLRNWIERRLGLQFEEAKLEFLAELLDRRAREADLAPSAYLDWLNARGVGGKEIPDAGAERELRALALELTVPETYFFRHVEQFRAFEEIAVEAAGVRPGRKLRILSAGCASGEEPYSIAILLRDRLVESGASASIRALDINSAMLAKARRGMYSSWALREVPAEVRRRWFREAGGGFELDAAIRAAVTFDEVNLVEDDPALFAPRTYDVIFCRNVLMYFGAERAQGLVERLTRSLEDQGYLFLGHAETLRGVSKDYHLCHTHGTFYYRRKSGSNEVVLATSVGLSQSGQGTGIGEPGASPKERVSSALGGHWTRAWLETVGRAADRIRALAEPPGVAPPGVAPPGADPSTAEPPAKLAGLASSNREGTQSGAPREARVHSALALLKRERFAEALDALGRRAAQQQEEDPEVSLLRAALLAHSGDLEAAREASTQLLERDEFNAGAHYLLALCHEASGDRRRAIEYSQSAAYLDAGFAMPRLYMGLMARRAGEQEAARRELQRALVLIEREDPSRLLLFGGGFGREALIALCRAELAAVEGAA